MSAAPAASLWIGPSGWSYPDWRGIVYPPTVPRGFKSLAYIARYFDAVEVNSTFYRLPTASAAAGWVTQVPADFRFAVKLTQVFTHTRAKYPDEGTVRAFCEGVAPLREAGKLGPLLIQFPWSFRYAEIAVDWLRRLADSFPQFERFIEVRHASWARPEALEALQRCGGYCNIDQPVLRSCLGPTQHVFGSDGYVRLHGRNAQHWFAENAEAFERYNYLYSDDEIREWVRRLNEMVKQARGVYVFANNHYRGQGPVNALELKALLTGTPVDVPPDLLAAYPRLGGIAKPAPPQTLFDVT